jgi:hypothetical protein
MQKSVSNNGVMASDMQACIDACANCHQVCLRTAMTHCLKMGGRHVEPEHFRLMNNCAEICQASANLQLSGSVFSARLCGLCADVCAACAESCRELDGMEDCVIACERCAASCHSMAA